MKIDWTSIILAVINLISVILAKKNEAEAQNLKKQLEDGTNTLTSR